jgi:hypothetical protein
MDAASVEPIAIISSEREAELVVDGSTSSRTQILATLERWLQNLEGRQTGRAR